MFIKNRYFGLAATILLFGLALGFTSSAEYASLRVNCVPAGDVFIDGVHVGESNRAFVVDSGEHEIKVTSKDFESFQGLVTVDTNETHTLECSLIAQNPSAPYVIAQLASSHGVDVAPFIAPELTRGSRRKGPIMLLWPSREVRKEGLVNYAIEVDETYDGDGTLEFRQGRKVLYRASFRPAETTSVRALPSKVLEAVKIGRVFTWGIYFEDGRRPVKKSLKIVRRPRVDRQLERLRKSKHIKRQPVITQQILAATVLENNRLYTEALVANLKVATDHPQSTQPYRGIVTTLRRLDAEGSELFAFVSPHVSGKGGNSGVSRPGSATGRRAAAGLGLKNWAPKQIVTGPNAAKPTESGTERRSGPGGAGVTPSGGNDSDAPKTPDEIPADRGEDVTPAEQREHAMQEMRNTIAQLEDEYNAINSVEADAREANTAAEDAARAAEDAVQAADQAASDAREAYENAATPTPEQRDAMRTAGEAAEAAREAAAGAHQALRDTQQRLEAASTRMGDLKRELDDMKQAADNANGETPVVPGVEAPGVPVEPGQRTEPTGPDAGNPQAGFETASQEAQTAQENLDAANAAFAAAQQTQNDSPSEANAAALEAAQAAVESATGDAAAKQEALEAARTAIHAAK